MRRSILFSVTLCILLFAGCAGPFSAAPQRKALSLIPGDNSFELARGITAYFNDVQKEQVVSYELQTISERTTLIFFYESDLEVPGPLFELSHSDFGVGEGQLLMVQPILSNTSFLPVETEFQSQCSRDSLSTLVRFTRLPYCLLISRADALYTAQHLPGKFLLEGDLLYHIGPNWIPSHSALYLGVGQETAMTDGNLGLNDGVTFGESYPFLTHGYNLVEEGVFVFPNAVQNDTYVSLFKYDTYESRWLKYWSTNFSGARRYPGEITPQERRQISRFMFETAGNGALWSVGFAWSGYWDLPFTERDLYSCVGIVEKAYESAGKNIVPFWEDMFYLNSFEQFSRTIPVPEITAGIGETIEFRVNSLLAEWQYVGYDKWSFSDHAWIWKSTNGVELETTSGTLTKKDDHCVFSWTPEMKGDYPVTFRFFGEFGNRTVEKTHTLTIHVVEKTS